MNTTARETASTLATVADRARYGLDAVLSTVASALPGHRPVMSAAGADALLDAQAFLDTIPADLRTGWKAMPRDTYLQRLDAWFDSIAPALTQAWPRERLDSLAVDLAARYGAPVAIVRGTLATEAGWRPVGIYSSSWEAASAANSTAFGVGQQVRGYYNPDVLGVPHPALAHPYWGTAYMAWAWADSIKRHGGSIPAAAREYAGSDEGAAVKLAAFRKFGLNV